MQTDDDRWAVECNGEDGGRIGARIYYPSRDPAIAAGVQKAKEAKVVLLIHGANDKPDELRFMERDTKSVLN
ncbi:hypothetical protein AU476_15135 [Cupriavidus sp. UYMSc13B]|nr:hypothetical protein AU476_15135 [Cupriavidus sp. UYMSc13B]